MPIANHRLLYLQRGVFSDAQALDDRGAYCGAARLSEQQRRLRVDVDEYLFHRHLRRAVGCNHFAQVGKDGAQPVR